ncbi:MAG: hypothetical protein JNM18_26630 [Planctomycetaceae bacterium]|nr:hypothetical protein [Planctomycetaceae bacterium]
MSKKKEKHRPRSRPEVDTAKTSEMATMAWMLTTLTTFVCVAIMAGSRAYVIWVDPEAASLAILSGLLLFASLVLGVLALGLELVVLRIRKPAPPRPVLFGSTVIALLPMVAALIVFLRQ